MLTQHRPYASQPVSLGPYSLAYRTRMDESTTDDLASAHVTRDRTRRRKASLSSLCRFTFCHRGHRRPCKGSPTQDTDAPRLRDWLEDGDIRDLERTGQVPAGSHLEPSVPDRSHLMPLAGPCAPSPFEGYVTVSTHHASPLDLTLGGLGTYAASPWSLCTLTMVTGQSHLTRVKPACLLSFAPGKQG
jgi:hypothetical protein